ncbi:MAG: o-succinylbenzoate synthase [Thermonemataceae bacterium]
MQHFPAIHFALEIAFQDLQQGGKRQLFENDFSNGTAPIPINGLIWMGPKSIMLQQIKEKLAAGDRCIKLKIGAIDFEEELALLKYIRTQFGSEEVIVRVDANGAFKPEEALEKLKRLAELALHSIEQPIATQQWEKMAKLCEQSPLPIALDEELIGVVDRKALLATIQPQYIILKPSLLGGWAASEAWIALAKKHNIGWWMTSALESNIGLNAIAQFTGNLSLHPTATYQGLGTGQLYHNNIPSPLEVNGGWLHYRSHVNWEVGDITKPE